MSKVTLETKTGKALLVNRLTYPESVNQRVFDALAAGAYPGFLPLHMAQKGKDIQLECVVQGLLPLAQYLRGTVSRQVFLDTVYEIAMMLQSCEKNRLDTYNVELSADTVYYDPVAKGLRCVYWPVVNYRGQSAMPAFFKDLAFQVRVDPRENGAYLETYKAFFAQGALFSLNSFVQMLARLAGKEEGSAFTAEENGAGSLFSPKSNIEYDPFAGVAMEAVKPASNPCIRCGAENPANAKFCGKCGASRQEEPKPAPDRNSTMAFGAMSLPQQPIKKTAWPTLTRVRIKGVFTVDKPVFKLGKEEATCDLVICDNAFISRQHAQIRTENGRCFITDLNSKNRTFVNGLAIRPGEETEIFSGTRVKLANEEFILEIPQ